MKPSETLVAAADLIRDLAAAATPGPWEQGERCVWEYNIGLPVVADCEKGEGGVVHEHDARWIAALSPALADDLAALLVALDGREFDAARVIAQRLSARVLGEETHG